MFTLRQMYWYNKKSWSYFSHAYFAEGKKFDLLPCSLLLSPLWEAWPPLEGPGVPAECVEVASSWSLQDEGFWCQSAKEFFPQFPIQRSKWRTERKPGEKGRRGGKAYTLAFVKCAKHQYCLHSVIILQQRQAEEVQRFSWWNKWQIFFSFKFSRYCSGFNCLNSSAEEYFSRVRKKN